MAMSGGNLECVQTHHCRQDDTPVMPISDWGHVEWLTETSQGCFHWSRIP